VGRSYLVKQKKQAETALVFKWERYLPIEFGRALIPA